MNGDTKDIQKLLEEAKLEGFREGYISGLIVAHEGIGDAIEDILKELDIPDSKEKVQ